MAIFEKGKWGRKPVGETLKNWPRLEDGSLEPPVFLCHSSGEHMEDVITINMLQAYGIPCVQINSNDGDFGEIILGVSVTGADLFVPGSMCEDAKLLIKGETEDHENL